MWKILNICNAQKDWWMDGWEGAKANLRIATAIKNHLKGAFKRDP